jgi:hypothetical protein
MPFKNTLPNIRRNLKNEKITKWKIWQRGELNGSLLYSRRIRRREDKAISLFKLSLTFLGWKNWLLRRQKLYSNYHLYQLPYIYVDTIEKLDGMREGFFVADELGIEV